MLSALLTLCLLTCSEATQSEPTDGIWFSEVGGGGVSISIVGDDVTVGSLPFPLTRCDNEYLRTCLDGERPVFRPFEKNQLIEYGPWSVIETNEFETGVEMLESEQASVIYIISYDQPRFIYYVSNDEVVMIAEVRFSDPGNPEWFIPHPGEDFEVDRLWVAASGNWRPFE